MTNEDRIRSLEKIAQSSEEQKAFLEGQAKAHGDYAKSRAESADSLSGWGKMVGVGGGGAGGAMTLKGVKQMLDKGPYYDPSKYDTRLFPQKKLVKFYSLEGGKIVPREELMFTPEQMRQPGFGRHVSGGPIVSRAKVPPRIQGKRLALKGGLLGLGSLGLSAALHGMASSNRNKANEHTKSLEQIKAQLR